MPIGIRPTIDFAFMKTFGTDENKICLLSLLNAILDLPIPIVDVTLENPFNLQEFEEDKKSILDVKAKDDEGAIFHVEMQLAISEGLVQRMVFYGCELYAGQLAAGDNYLQLCPVFSICLLEGILWKDSDRVHSCFRLLDKDSGRSLDNTLQIHILELGRYNRTEAEVELASQLDKWIYWLLHAHQYEPDELKRLLPEQPFQLATQTITIIKSKTEEKSVYDSREKALRDYQWHIDAAHLKGLAEGKAEGKAEGEKKGIIIGKINTLQLILNQSVIPDDVLRNMTIEQVESMADQLQEEFHNRRSN